MSLCPDFNGVLAKSLMQLLGTRMYTVVTEFPCIRKNKLYGQGDNKG